MKRSLSFVVALALPLALGVTLPAHAYVGPGAGLSLLGALWGLVVAVGAAVGFVLLWPLRRALRRRRATAAPGAQPQDPRDPAAR